MPRAVALHLLSALVSADGGGALAAALFAGGFAQMALQELPRAAEEAVSAPPLHSFRALQVAQAQMALLLALVQSGARRRSRPGSHRGMTCHEGSGIAHLGVVTRGLLPFFVPGQRMFLVQLHGMAALELLVSANAFSLLLGSRAVSNLLFFTPLLVGMHLWV